MTGENTFFTKNIKKRAIKARLTQVAGGEYLTFYLYLASITEQGIYAGLV
jgi:hypothetical protein